MNEDKEFLKEILQRFLADKTLASLSVSNDYGQIEMSRHSEDNGVTNAIGFAMDDTEENEE